jgi:putative ABC transport system permease protein
LIQRMIVQNVLHRPVRAVITVLAVAVEVTLVIIVVGLTTGLLTDTAKRVEGVGADIMVQPPSASIFMAFSGATMPIAIGDRLAELPHVRAVAPVQVQFNSVNGLDLVYGIDPKTFNAVTSGFVFHSGHDLQKPDDILIDDWYERGKHVTTGQTLHILEHDFKVVGVVEHGKGARVFALMSTLEELSGAHDKASVFFLKCDQEENTSTVVDEVGQLLPRYTVRPTKDFISLMTSSNLPGLGVFVNSMIGLAVAIGFLVIFLSMYTTVTERTREVGTLKALGASKSYIARVILSETTLLCLIGIAGGIGMAYGVKGLFLHAFPTLTILITPAWLVKAAGIAMIGGIIGASYPAWAAARKDPVEALAYE